MGKRPKVIYPGSFNPWTIGHQNIYERAKKAFGEVVVVLANNPAKNINIEQVRYTLEPLNIPVEICDGLIATDADIIVRGVRSGDWEYELNLAQWNKEIGAETVFFAPAPELSHITSSAVRLLYNNGSDVQKYFVNYEVYRRWCLTDNY